MRYVLKHIGRSGSTEVATIDVYEPGFKEGDVTHVAALQVNIPAGATIATIKMAVLQAIGQDPVGKVRQALDELSRGV